MASAQQQFLTLDNAEDVETFFLLLESKLGIEKIEKDSDKVLRLISMVGLEALKKIRKICLPKKITELTFKELKDKIISFVKPTAKLTWAERTKFFSLKQEKGENIKEYVAKLRNQATNCNFEALKQVENIEESMVVHQLICGVESKHHQEKILESAAIKVPTVTSILSLVENMQQISSFCDKRDSNEVLQVKPSYNQKFVNRKCSFCGNPWHKSLLQCPAKKIRCKNCNLIGHFSNCCKKTQVTKRTKQFTRSSVNEVNDIFHISEENFIHSRFENIYINERCVKFMLDTGATVSLLPTRVFETLNIPLNTSKILTLETYDGHKLKCLGTASVTINYKGKPQSVDFRVVESERDYGLLGRDVLSVQILQVEKHLPTIKGVQASIRLKPGATNMFCKARRVPLSMENEVNKTLEQLEEKGIIEKCNSDTILNTSPVVWVRKKTGKLRMCPDYKVHLNNKIYTEDYPLPTVDAIFSKLSGSKYFATIDLKDAYWQIEIDEESQKLCSINTSKGLYKVKRLQMGLKNSAAIFQNVVENSVLKGLSNVVAYQDDLVIYAKTEESLKKHVNTVECRLKSKGVTINEEKTVRNAKEIEYLGRIINAEGIKPNKSHLEKALQIKKPENKKDIQSVMGFFNFFREFIKDFSKKTLFLTDKLSTETFQWSAEDEKELSSLKEELLKEPVLIPYDINKEILIETDASQRAIAAIITQNGHPITYLSKKLSTAQKNWSNIEREAYAIFWTITKMRRMLLGRQFCVKTDHRPLQFIFSNNKGVSTRTSARIARWALQLMPYDFTIEHKPGTSLQHVDMLSRFSNNEEADTIFETSAADIPFNENSISVQIKELSERDDVYNRILSNIRNNKWSKFNKTDRKFYKFRWHFTVHNDLIYYGTRLYIPIQFTKVVIEKAHETHQGREAMQKNIRSEFWWPNMSVDIINHLSGCVKCAEKRPIQKNKLSSWPQSANWERIHIDWAFPPNYGLVFIAVDAATNFIDAIPCSDRSVTTVKRCLSRLFGFFGLPLTVVSDNAPEFIALKTWLAAMGIKLIHSPPYSPSSNGQAERAVRTIKNALACYEDRLGDRFVYLQKILLNHRCCSGAISPAENLFNFRPRTALNSQFSPGQDMIYKNKMINKNDHVKYVVQAGANTAWVNNDKRTWLASLAQLQPIIPEPKSNLQTYKNWKSGRIKTKPPRKLVP